VLSDFSGAEEGGLASRLRQVQAVQDFDRLRERAIIQDLVSAITRSPSRLLPFEEVRRLLHIHEVGERGLQDIPLDKIVGSVGRYNDFTRTFLPRTSASRQRWANLKNLAGGLSGWPPIEVYQVGDVYFVKDGNHRVSVAMDMGMKTIQAYVTECASPVPLSNSQITAADLMLMADRADFLTRTNIDNLRPGHGIELTLPGRYQDLLAHIAAHQYALDQQSNNGVTWEEATIDWYDNVYRPLVDMIGQKNLLKEFPHRTAADLYAWIIEHELELREVCGSDRVGDQVAVDDFADLYSERPLVAQLKSVRRFLDNLLHRRRPPCEGR
jgi:hypothetical protein